MSDDAALDLDELEGVALMADHGGRRWTHRINATKGYPQPIMRVSDSILVAECYDAPEYPPTFADFITTFDPPTVLALIALAREARTP